METSSNLTSYRQSSGWTATDIFLGSTAYFGNNTAYSIYGGYSQTFYVTNCTQVKALVKSTSSSYKATLKIYEGTLDESGNITYSSNEYDSQSGGANGLAVITSVTLDENKIYKVQLTGYSDYPDLLEIGFKKGSLNNEYSSDAYLYADSYGWNIPGTIEGSSYKYFKIDEYKPEEEGVTLLLM